jgi:hypothetical protein
MHDIVDIIKNVQTLSTNDTAFQILKDFERVLDELDLYVFANWEDGELLAGPDVNRYSVECKFMWPRENMPDPDGGARLLDYGCKVIYEKDNLIVPRKVYSPDDFRPQTKKGKLDAHPIWVVKIIMPKKLMQDMFQGYENRENHALADSLKYEQLQQENQQAVAGAGEEAAAGGAPTGAADMGGAVNAPAPTV